MNRPVTVSRRAWLGYRWDRHGLGAPLRAAARADLLFLGVQETRLGTAAQALARRGMGEPVGPARALVTLWSVRGAPHVHPRDDLADVRAGTGAAAAAPARCLAAGGGARRR
ncbi:hypothetical protein [Nocardia sp. NPDC057353]|uniref:hypothetical protein n=1 Tax=Nocardia sp. NPDC057353 TaxID=3346104 RepID=UPI0036363A67